MMKSIGTVQLALATVFVVPAVTGQDENVNSLQSQLSATLNSLDYLAELRDRAATGDRAAIGAIVSTTEAPRDPQRAGGSYLESLQTDLARLRFQLDRLLGTPSEVKAIMQLPGSVVRSLGLAGAPAARRRGRTTGRPEGADERHSAGAPRSRAAPGAGRPRARHGELSGMSPARCSSRSTPSCFPLDSVTESARRRGAEAVALEGAGYVAAPTRLGRLYVRRGRAAEAVTVLEPAPECAGPDVLAGTGVPVAGALRGRRGPLPQHCSPTPPPRTSSARRSATSSSSTSAVELRNSGGPTKR